MPVDAVRLHALRHTVHEWWGFPVRFKLEAADNPGMRGAVVLADRTTQDATQPWTTKAEVPCGGTVALYLRLTATRLRAIEGRAALALSQIEVLGSTPDRRNSAAIGFLPEERGLYSHMSAIETIVYFGQLKEMDARLARERGMDLLERFDLGVA